MTKRYATSLFGPGARRRPDGLPAANSASQFANGTSGMHGQQYFERCVRAIEEHRAGEGLLESGRREVAGRLSVFLPLLFGRYCAAPILRAYARQHPKLKLELSFSYHQVDLIADGFDLAVRNGSLGTETSLHARRLVSQ